MGVEILGEKVVLFREASGKVGTVVVSALPLQVSHIVHYRCILSLGPCQKHDRQAHSLKTLLTYSMHRPKRLHIRWQVVAINDVCPHRGAPLHMGWTANVDGHDCVVCPYHGAHM